MKIPAQTIVNLKTGEEKDLGEIELSEKQIKTAIEFLADICINSKSA